MACDESVTTWLAGAKDGSETAVQRIWERYYRRLVGLARSVLQSTPGHDGEEEDVAASAFESFYFRAAAGKFPKLDDRDDLWKLLMTITVRKAFGVRRKDARKPPHRGLDELKDCLAADEPTPEIAASVTSEFQRLLRLLDDPHLCSVALAKLDGFTNREIAQRLDRSLSFVERKMHVIRSIWSNEIPQPGAEEGQETSGP